MVRFKVRVRVLGLGLVVGLRLGLILQTCHANLVLRVIWQCDIFGITPSLVISLVCLVPKPDSA